MKKSELVQLNAVIGYPLTYSQSPRLHMMLYKQLGLNAAMLPLAHPEVRPLIVAMKALPIYLTAVTMPFKQSIMPLLDSVDKQAKAVGAVNTVINKSGKLYGYNTDIFGIEFALRGTKLKGKQVLLLGAGGAARAAASVVSKHQGRLMYLNRTREKAAALQKKFGGRAVQAGKLTAKGIDVIINATPVGMRPKISAMPISQKLIGSHQTVFDLVYNPVNTRLLQAAKLKEAKTVSGLEMFAAQGVRQIEIWTGQRIINPKLLKSAFDFVKTGMQ